MFEPDEQAFEIVFTGFLDLTAIDMDVVDDEPLLRHERVEVVAQRAHVLREFLGVFLERHEYARVPRTAGRRSRES